MHLQDRYVPLPKRRRLVDTPTPDFSSIHLDDKDEGLCRMRGCTSLRSHDMVQPDGLRCCERCGAIRDAEQRDIKYEVNSSSTAVPYPQRQDVDTTLNESSKQANRLKILKMLHLLNRLPEVSVREFADLAAEKKSAPLPPPSPSPPPPMLPQPPPPPPPPPPECEPAAICAPPKKPAVKRKAVAANKDPPKKKYKKVAEADPLPNDKTAETIQKTLEDIKSRANDAIPLECFNRVQETLNKKENRAQLNIRGKEAVTLLCTNLLLLYCWDAKLPFEWTEFQTLTGMTSVIENVKIKQSSTLWNKAVSMAQVNFDAERCKGLCENSITKMAQLESIVRQPHGEAISSAALKYFEVLCKKTSYFEDNIAVAARKTAKKGTKPIRSQVYMPRLWHQAAILCLIYAFEIDDNECAICWEALSSRLIFPSSTVISLRRRAEASYPAFAAFVGERRDAESVTDGARSKRWALFAKKS